MGCGQLEIANRHLTLQLNCHSGPTITGSARVSTKGQESQLQRNALESAGCGRIFEDKKSRRATARPGFVEGLDHLRPTDTLCVWKLDRLGRSAKNLLTNADSLHERGVGLHLLTGTYSPTGEGKFFFVIMAAFTALKRTMIRERTLAGLAVARAQGRTGSRPTVMEADTLAAA